MADQVKDFAYYADKAEQQLQLSLGRDERGQILPMDDATKTRHVMRGQAYATLAAGAPVSPIAPCTSTLTAVGPTPMHDRERPCVYDRGHPGDHCTADGVRFTDRT